MSAAFEVTPVEGAIHATVTVPGSKSHTNRALACAALADGPSVLEGTLDADDTRAMRSAVASLGASVGVSGAGTTVEVEPPAGGLATRAAQIDASLSGTTARFVLALASTGSAPIVVDGLPPLRRRPMGPSLAALGSLGVSVEELGVPGHLPARVAGPPTGTEVVVDGSISSQFVSGLLLAGPGMPAGLAVSLTGPIVSAPYLDLTVDVMSDFGVAVERPSRRQFLVPKLRYRGGRHRIEPDASTASYFFAAAAITGGSVTVTGLGVETRQGDLAFLDVLSQMGASIGRTHDAITVTKTGPLRGVEVDMSDISDTAQTLAVVAVFADSPTRVTGIGFIREKETDRIAAVVRELERCGIDAREETDGFVIHPGQPRAATVQTYDDHRMAMSFALMGLRAPGIRLTDPQCVAKTFPGFWDTLASLGSGGTGDPG